MKISIGSFGYEHYSVSEANCRDYHAVVRQMSSMEEGGGWSLYGRGLMVIIDGRIVWMDSDIEYADLTFAPNNILSNEYHKVVVLQRKGVGLVPIAIDWESSCSLLIGPDGFYCEEAGHFYSFDAAYYRVRGASTFECYQFNDGSRYSLMDKFSSLSSRVVAWCVCPVKNCVLCIMEEGYACLFDICKEIPVCCKEIPLQNINTCTFSNFCLDKERGLVMGDVRESKSGMRYNISIEF